MGGVLAEWLNQHKENYIAERDLQMFHYMCLHPEDFPKPSKIFFACIFSKLLWFDFSCNLYNICFTERVLFRDYLQLWYPIR